VARSRSRWEPPVTTWCSIAAEARRYGARVRDIRADVTDVADVRRRFAGLERLDVLVNAAGSYPPKDFLSSSADDWLESYATHVVAALTCIQSTVALMPAGASIINITSIAAHRAPPEMGPYAASKAALLSLTRSAALALAPRGIRVNAVSPGLISREGLDVDWPEGLTSWQSRAPLSSPVHPASVASACVFLASADAITGQELVIDSGITIREDYS
jgi:3-oxoacyl-[acyl-carrier protein] reductase